MTLGTTAMLFCAMALLAALPSVSTLTVAARAAASGLAHGVFTGIGIVAGDLIYVLIAILGMSALAQWMGSLYGVAQCIGGVYLMVLGAGLWRTAHAPVAAAGASSLWSSFLTGLVITLGDQKAILFYLGFFPAYVDLQALTWGGALIIAGVTVGAVGGVKLAYACVASRAGVWAGAAAGRGLSLAAGAVLIATGLVLIIRLALQSWTP